MGRFRKKICGLAKTKLKKLKTMKQFIKKFIGETLLTGGVGLLIYNIFNFSYRGGTGGKWTGDLPQLTSLGGYEFEYVAYYYNQSSLLTITAGAMLIVIGILIIKNKKPPLT